MNTIPRPTEKIKVFVAENHPYARHGLYQHLISIGHIEIVPFEAKDEDYALNMPADIKETINLIKESKPDVVVMDVKWGPDKFAGIEAQKEIQKELKNTKVLLFTTHSEPELIRRAVDEPPAYGYILKDEASELESAIRKAFKGEMYYGSKATEYLVNTKTPASGQKKPRHTNILTQDEQVVLTHMARGESNKQIAQNLNISESTVKSRIQNIYEKLGIYPHNPKLKPETIRKAINPRVLAILKGLEYEFLTCSDLVPTKLDS